VEYLGIVLQSNADGDGLCTKSLSVKRRTYVREVLLEFQRTGRMRVGKVQSVQGLLQFCAQCIFGCRLYYQPLSGVLRGQVDPNRMINVPGKAKASLKWIQDRLRSESACQEVAHRRELTQGFASWDASTSIGFGGFLDGLYFAVTWEEVSPGGHLYHELYPGWTPGSLHINYMEVFAGFWFLKEWGPRLRGRTLVCYTDNTTAQSAMMKLTSTPTFVRLLKQIHLLLVRYDIRLDLHYLESKANVLSDTLSRQDWAGFGYAFAEWSGVAHRSVDSEDWQFSPPEFEDCDREFGPHDLDASSDQFGRNAMLQCFWSEKDDCRKQNFGGLNVWLNTAFSIILEVLQNFIRCKEAHPIGTALTMVVPVWPEKEWFTLLMRHPKVFRVVRRYPAGSDLFTCPIPVEHGGGRRSVGPTKWPVLVFRVHPGVPEWGM
jgi:hypothetical protein